MISFGAGSPIQPPWTVEFWVNRQDTPAYSSVLFADDISALKLEQFNYTRALGFTRFHVADYSFNYSAPAESWVHVAYVTRTNSTILYVNGAPAETNNATIPLPLQWFGWDNFGDRLCGTVDEVRVWNVARQEEEIRNHLRTSLPLPQTNLLAYWKFDEGTGTAVLDSSGNGHTGMLVNGPQWVSSTAPLNLPPMVVELKAIRVADDDGSRQARISPEQVQQWVDFANRVWADAGIAFSFNPAADFGDVRSTLVNNMMGNTDASWDTERTAANHIAAQYPGKLTVLFRWGSGTSPTGGGFSWWDYSYVVCPGFYDTWHCGQQNITVLAHEIGHHLGLPHTFGGTFANTTEASNFFAAHGNDPSIFDGDGFSDTPPHPSIQTQECPGTNRIVLNGVPFTLPRNNIMSYYHEAINLTPQQVQRARWLTANYLRNEMLAPSNQGLPAPLEAEMLPIVQKNNSSTGVQQMDGFGKDGWSANAQLFCNFSPGSYIALQFPVTQTGRFQLDVYATQAPDFGSVTFSVDDVPIGSSFDAYAPVVLPSGRITLGAFSLIAGNHRLKIACTGKNSLSTSYFFGIDCLNLITPTTPTISSFPLSQTVTGGTNLSFPVAALGTPPLNYEWRRDGIRLGPTDRISGADSRVLAISNVLHTDTGDYSVVITNLAGGVTSAPPASLKVYAAVLASPVWFTKSSLRFDARGEVGSVFEFQRSSDLLTWSTVSFVTNDSGAFVCMETNALPVGFYRLKWAR